MPSIRFAPRFRHAALVFLLGHLTVLSGIGCRDAGVPSRLGDGGADAARDAGDPDGAEGGAGGSVGDGGTSTDVGERGLVMNELCADDDGFQIDEHGQTDDWIEIANRSSMPRSLAGLTLDEGGARHVLPAVTLPPGGTFHVWADDSPEQGPRHLGFELAAGGGRISLRGADGTLLDEVTFPSMPSNQSWARFPDGAGTFASCRYASPGRPNGDRCGPPPRPELPAIESYAPYQGAPIGRASPGPLVISEAALRPARFVEIANVTQSAVDLTGYVLRLAAHGPGLPLPDTTIGTLLPWPAATIAAGGHLVVPLAAADIMPLGNDPAFEGVISLFDRSGQAMSRMPFSRVATGSVLALVKKGSSSQLRLCSNDSAGAANTACTPVAHREVGDRTRELATPDDLRALAAGGTEIGSLAVKVVVDMAAGDAVHFLSARRWPLHYTFVRERIYQQTALDRCDAVTAAEFEAGWREFSDREYFVTTGRRFLLATVVRHAGSTMTTVEFDRSDVITGEQMRRAFFAIAAHADGGDEWAIRPQGERQQLDCKALEGTVPIVDMNAPFRGVQFQAITPGTGFGVLRFVRADELRHAKLGIDVIVVTDDVPNDVPLTGGLITEVFQTPLSHVGILTRNRGTPNMALPNARADARLRDLWDKLVRLDVVGGGFTLAAATPSEAQAFWDARRPKGERLHPRLDASVRGLQDLRERSLDDLPAIGAKAAQLAELLRVRSSDPACPGPIPTPLVAHALPIAHGLDHFEASGAKAILAAGRAQTTFLSDATLRASVLNDVKAAILGHPVDPAVLGAIESMAAGVYGKRRFRLRSSSNTEDLPGFTGAGLYHSVSAALGDPKRSVADGLRAVWASLWQERAWDERELGNIDQDVIGMGVLIHEAYHDVERANGVIVSRDVHDPGKSQVTTINAQAGEASVTNPAPGVTGEALKYAWWKTPPVLVEARSNLIDGAVLRAEEIALFSCHIRAIESHFRTRLDPSGTDRWFTVESEWKLIGPERTPIIKQARPYSFGTQPLPQDCR